MKNKIPLVVAHRGYSAKFPENTQAAFQAAIAAGAAMIELDVHLSRDGALIVTHDFELGRTSSGKGTLADFSSRELRSLDAGSWFAPYFKGERFPVLGEVLAMAKGKIDLNIEIKEETLVSETAYQTMAEKILVMVNGHAMRDHVVISSFDWKILERIRSQDSDLRLGLLNHEPEKGLRWEEAGKIRAYSYHPNFKTFTAQNAAEVREHGLKLFPYTANTEEEFRRLIELGADGIITNEVERLQDFLKATSRK
ncbi:MAG: glycerophosphodiester phosphodiesterase [Bdellovibrionota bacterium]